MISVDNLLANFPNYVEAEKITPTYSLTITQLITQTQYEPEGSSSIAFREKLVNSSNIEAAMESDISAFQAALDTAIVTIQSTKEEFRYTPKLFVGQFTVSDLDAPNILSQKSAEVIGMFNKIFDLSNFRNLHANAVPVGGSEMPIDDFPSIAKALATIKNNIIDAVGGQNFPDNFRFALTGSARQILSYVSPEGSSFPLNRQYFVEMPNDFTIPDYENSIYAVYQPSTVLWHSRMPDIIDIEKVHPNATVRELRKTTVICGLHSTAIQKYNDNAIMVLKVKP